MAPNEISDPSSIAEITPKGEALPPAGTRKAVGRKRFEPEIREHVIKAATKAIESKGLEGLKARPIAARAGISVGSIYNLFGDLDELTRIVNGRTYDALYEIERSALEQAREAGKSPRAQMMDLAAAYLEFVETHQDIWLAALAFNRSQTEQPPQWYLDKEQALFRIIEDAIATFPGAAEIEARQNNARALWASIHGIVTVAVADGFLMQPIANVWTQIQIIVNAVAGSLESEEGT